MQQEETATSATCSRRRSLALSSAFASPCRYRAAPAGCCRNRFPSFLRHLFARLQLHWVATAPSCCHALAVAERCRRRGPPLPRATAVVCCSRCGPHPPGNHHGRPLPLAARLLPYFGGRLPPPLIARLSPACAVYFSPTRVAPDVVTSSRLKRLRLGTAATPGSASPHAFSTLRDGRVFDLQQAPASACIVCTRHTFPGPSLQLEVRLFRVQASAQANVLHQANELLAVQAEVESLPTAPRSSAKANDAQRKKLTEQRAVLRRRIAQAKSLKLLAEEL